MSISMIRAQEPQRVVDAGRAMNGTASALDGLIAEQVRAAHAMRESWFELVRCGVGRRRRKPTW